MPSLAFNLASCLTIRATYDWLRCPSLRTSYYTSHETRYNRFKTSTLIEDQNIINLSPNESDHSHADGLRALDRWMVVARLSE